MVKITNVLDTQLGINFDDPNNSFVTFVATTCAKAMDKFVPYDNGDLRKYKIQGNLIIYGDGPSNAYARYQYYGMRQDGTRVVRKYTTPGTGNYWDRRMWSAKKNEVIETIQRELARRSKK